MKQTFNLAKFRTVYYSFNPETGYYVKSEKQLEKGPFMRLPYELKFEYTRADKIRVNAKQIIHSRQKTKTGSFLFFTGLQDTGVYNWYLGNDCEYIDGEKVLSIVLFRFTDDNSRLIVYYFPWYDKSNTRQRLRFALEIIPTLS